MPVPDVWITPLDPPGSRPIGFGLLGDATTSVYTSGGYSWTVIDRPTSKPFLEFTSIALTQLDLPLMLDRADAQDSVEADCDAVHGWRYKVPGKREPARLRVTGPVDTARIPEWVLFGVTWKAAQRRLDQVRVQQEVTLTLLEASRIDTTYGSPVELAQQQITATNQAAAALLPGLASLPPDLLAQIQAYPPGSWRTYVIRDGDDLTSIAAQQLGDLRLWVVIAQMNNVRDPAAITAGQTLQLPW
jgi:hypothetical protein